MPSAGGAGTSGAPAGRDALAWMPLAGGREAPGPGRLGDFVRYPKNIAQTALATPARARTPANDPPRAARPAAQAPRSPRAYSGLCARTW
jgi:hypothetical protein